MYLGWSAITLASHVTIVIALMLAFSNFLVSARHWVDMKPIDIFEPLEVPLFCMGAAVIIERLFYVVARYAGDTLDLWSAHPAPDILSASVAASALFLAVAVRRLGDMSRVVGFVQVGFVFLVHIAISWTLY